MQEYIIQFLSRIDAIVASYSNKSQFQDLMNQYPTNKYDNAVGKLNSLVLPELNIPHINEEEFKIFTTELHEQLTKESNGWVRISVVVLAALLSGMNPCIYMPAGKAHKLEDNNKLIKLTYLQLMVDRLATIFGFETPVVDAHIVYIDKNHFIVLDPQ